MLSRRHQLVQQPVYLVDQDLEQSPVAFRPREKRIPQGLYLRVVASLIGDVRPLEGETLPDKQFPGLGREFHGNCPYPFLACFSAGRPFLLFSYLPQFPHQHEKRAVFKTAHPSSPLQQHRMAPVPEKIPFPELDQPGYLPLDSFEIIIGRGPALLR